MAHRLAGCNTSVARREGDRRERMEVKWAGCGEEDRSFMVVVKG